MPVPVAEQRKLYQLSGNMCAFPGCRRELTAEGTDRDPLVVVSEVAHIVGDSSDGPRGKSELTAVERNKYENLILLCNQHHQLIDSQPNTWTVERLLEMKRAHEAWVRQKLGTVDIVTGVSAADERQKVDVSGLPTVGSVADIALLRVHPAIPLPGRPPPDLHRDLPSYIPRDADRGIREALAAMATTGGFLLLLGRAASGKTRLAYEAVNEVMPNWRLFLPASVTDIKELSQSELGSGQIIVWLDDLERFLELGQLSSGMVQRLIDSPKRPVIVIGTIWPEHYDRLREHGGPDDARTRLHREAREVLRLAHRFEIASEFSQAEQARAREIARVDPRVREAIEHAEAGSPTAVLACAPELVYRWKHASHTAGVAVLNAAVDIRLCGHVRVIPARLLEQLAAAYLPAVERATAPTDWFASAARWATAPIRGTISALIPHAGAIGRVDGYVVSDILLAEAVRSPDFSPRRILVATWDCLADEADPTSCVPIGHNAITIGHVDAGRRALRRAADAGSVIAPGVLGFSYFDEGNYAEAMRWFQQANDLLSGQFTSMIAVVYRELGDSAQERLWLERAANAGDLGGMMGYGNILEGEGDLDAASRWYQQAIDQGCVPAMTYMAGLQRRLGNLDACTAWMERAAAAGEPNAMMNLALDRYNEGDLAGAEQWLQAAAEEGEITAAARLAQLLRETGRIDEAAQWALRAAEAGHTPTYTMLGMLLAELGEGEQAEEWLRRGVDAGEPDAMLGLGSLLEERGDTQIARRLFARAATEYATPRTLIRYALFLDESGDSEGARGCATPVRAGRRHRVARGLCATGAPGDSPGLSAERAGGCSCSDGVATAAAARMCRVTSRRRSRPAWEAAGAAEVSATESGAASTEAEHVVEDALADLWSYSGSGASSGRGYHYQDSVGGWLAAAIFAGQIGVARLVPEGLEDLSGEGADPWHVQVKSRQERIGDFSGAEAAGHIVKAWIRHNEREELRPGARLAVVFERAIDGEDFAGWGVPVADALPPDHPFLAELLSQAAHSGLDAAEAVGMCASVCVVVLGWEQTTEESIDAVTSRVTLLRGEALPVVLALRGAVADCADDNAERGWDNRSSLSRTDIEALVRQTVELIDREGLGEAVAAGICEPVDFRSAAPPVGFYQGVDVQPSHVTAGLVEPRPKLTDETVAALSNSQAALVVGPSGIGKSALAWSTAYVMRHVLWYRVWRLHAEDVEPLLRLARAAGANARTPVGFVVDAVGRADIQEWDALQRRASAIPGLLLMATARMEDLLLLRTLPDCGLVHVSLDEDLAERIYRGLTASGATTAAHWRQAYEQAAGLTMEYTHLLIRGRRLGAVIGDQVRARLDESRTVELDVLAIASVAHRWGASVSVSRLRDHLGISNATLGAALHRLADELLLQVQHDRVTGLHQLRSAVLVDAIHAVGSPSLAESARTVVELVDDPQLRPFVAGMLADHPEVDQFLLECLAGKLAEQPDASLLAGILHALRVVDFHRVVAAWPAVLHRHAVPPADMVVTLQMALWIGKPIPGLRPEIAAAASEIAATDQDSSTLRDELLQRLGADLVLDALLGCSTPQHARRLLGALANCPPEIVEHFLPHPVVGSMLVQRLSDAALADLANALSAARHASAVISNRLFEALGGQPAMLDRFRAAFPWATDVHIATPGGVATAVVRLAHINDDQQPNPDEQARELAHLLLRCFPQCKVVDVTTHLAIGIDFRIGSYSPGVSGLQRRYEHGPTQVAWNRARLRVAAAPVGATDTTKWLHTAAQLLDDLSTFTGEFLRWWVRGSRSSQELESIKNRMFDLSRSIDELPAPIEVTRIGAEDVDEQGTVPSGHPFHTLARGLVANLPGRLPRPSEWPSLVGFVADFLPSLISQLRTLHWPFIGLTDPPRSLDDLTVMLRSLHDIMTVLATDELTLERIHAAARDGEPQRALRRAAASARVAAAARQRQLTTALEQQIEATGLRVELLTHRPVGHGLPAQHEYALAVRLDSLAGWLPALEALHPILTAYPFTGPVLVVPFRRGRPVRGLACTFITSFLPDIGMYEQWSEHLPDAHPTPMANAFVQAREAIRALSAIGEVQHRRGHLDLYTDLADKISGQLHQALDEISRLAGPDAITETLLQNLGELLQRLDAELADSRDPEADTIAAAIAKGYLGEATTDWVVLQATTVLANEWDIDPEGATQLLEEWLRERDA